MLGNITSTRPRAIVLSPYEECRIYDGQNIRRGEYLMESGDDEGQSEMPRRRIPDTVTSPFSHGADRATERG